MSINYDADHQTDIPADELKDYVTTKSKRREVMIKKTADSGLNIISCKLIDSSSGTS